ncbi:glycosyltransferase family 4 protein [Mycobacterium sp. NBC_00419]|uniref:glycosyltransferase family 4 protein n=1 Tax=Mycobacterium sp. NBC_00419 TaxID=2975989 RepID=UPI002E1FB4FC
MLSLNYPPEPTGIASYTGALAAGLTAAGYAVEAHVAHPHYPEWSIHEGYGQWTSAEQLDGVSVLRRLHYVPQPPRGLRRLLSELSFGVRLVLSRWSGPRVVIALSPPLFATALTVLRLRLTPRRPRLIVWVQDIYSLGLAETGEGGELVRVVTGRVEAHTLRAADRVVVLHQRFADFLVRELGVSPSRIVVLRNWTHLRPSEEVDASSAKAALGWPNDMTLAVHTGNMGAKQALENVVDAARIADERGAPVHFILVGDGGERRSLEHYAAGVSRISFVDPLDDAEYRLALGAADVLLVNEKPGVSAMAMPCKLTSYFDAGRPVVAATDLDGITASEIAEAGAGVVVHAGDPAELLDAVLSMAADPETAGRYGLNGRRHRERVLDERIAIENWTALIDSVAAGRETP